MTSENRDLSPLKNLLIPIALILGLVIGFYVGFDFGATVEQSMQMQGLKGVWLNETAARHCNMTVENATARIACSPELNQTATYP